MTNGPGSDKKGAQAAVGTILAFGGLAAIAYFLTRPAADAPPSGGDGPNAPGQTTIKAFAADRQNPKVGESLVLSGVLQDSKGVGIEGEPVDLYSRDTSAGEGFIRQATVITRAGGYFTYTVPSLTGPATFDAQASYTGNPAEALLASNSDVVTVIVGSAVEQTGE